MDDFSLSDLKAILHSMFNYGEFAVIGEDKMRSSGFNITGFSNIKNGSIKIETDQGSGDLEFK